MRVCTHISAQREEDRSTQTPRLGQIRRKTHPSHLGHPSGGSGLILQARGVGCANALACNSVDGDSSTSSTGHGDLQIGQRGRWQVQR